MKFKKHTVHKKLEPYINTIIQIETDCPINYKVLTKSKIGFLFHYMKDDILLKDEINSRQANILAISGFKSSAVDFSLTGKNGFFLVHFNHCAKSVIKELEAIKTLDDDFNMKDIYSSSTHLEEQLKNEPDDKIKLHLIEKFIFNIITQKDINIYIDEAVKNIIYSNGTIHINDLSKKIGYSQKQLIRLFKTHVGITPKKFSKIIQFENTIQLLKNFEGKYSEIALEAGYFDQAHFINSFKQTTGVSPDKFLLENPQYITSLTNNIFLNKLR